MFSYTDVSTHNILAFLCSDSKIKHMTWCGSCVFHRADQSSVSKRSTCRHSNRGTPFIVGRLSCVFHVSLCTWTVVSKHKAKAYLTQSIGERMNLFLCSSTWNVFLSCVYVWKFYISKSTQNQSLYIFVNLSMAVFFVVKK